MARANIGLLDSGFSELVIRVKMLNTAVKADFRHSYFTFIAVGFT